MAKNCVTNIDYVRAWFYEQEGVLWTLYHKVTAKNKSKNIANKQIDKDWDKDRSWELLKRTLSRYKDQGARFTILVKSGPSDGIGTRLYIDLDSSKSQASMAGIAGYDGGKMNYDTIRGLIETEANRKAEQEKKQFILERKIDDLERDLEHQQTGSFWEEMIKEMARNGQLNRMFQLAMVNFSPNPQQAAQVTGFEGEAPEPTAGPQHIDDDPQRGEEFIYDMQRLRPILERLRDHFPNIYESLDELANAVEDNPPAAKAFLRKTVKNES